MKSKILIIFLMWVVLLTITVGVSAQNSYSIDWWTIDSGGRTFSSGGAYSLGGTIGQPDAGVLAAGNYTLSGGFWNGPASPQYRVFLPLVVKNTP